MTSVARLSTVGTSCEQCGIRIDDAACPFVSRRRSADELIYLEGEPADHVWFLLRGTVLMYREAGESRGEGRVRAVRFGGSFVGLEALVSPRYLDSARALTEVTLCGAPLAAVERWLGPPTHPARRALELTLRTDAADSLPRTSSDGTATQRVAAWLRDEGPADMTLLLPRRIAADLLGMRPETLSRALATLARRGAITVDRQELRIVDPAKLAECAG